MPQPPTGSPFEPVGPYPTPPLAGFFFLRRKHFFVVFDHRMLSFANFK